MLAVLSGDRNRNGNNATSAAAFFCWQHKDQAIDLMNLHGVEKSDTQVLELKTRTSIDTLISKLGVLEVQDPKERDGRDGNPDKARFGKRVKKDALPKPWQQVSGPLLEVSEDSLAEATTPARPQFVRPSRPQQTHRRRRGLFSLLCCHGSDMEVQHPPRPRPRPARRRPSDGEADVSGAASDFRHGVTQNRIQHGQAKTTHHRPGTTPTMSQTAALRAWIPDTVPPQTFAALMTELSKPLTASDKSTGYIYMFWETPNSRPAPDVNLTRSLLEGDSSPRSTSKRRTSDALQSLSASKTVTLKIGRADNVTRRLHQWMRQCGRPITLIRFYPYVKDVQGHDADGGARVLAGKGDGAYPVPNVARVERLILVELASRRVKRKCDCGTEHREWFEVDASREGLRSVDEVIRRWVRWGEQMM